MLNIDELKFDAQGLIPAVVVDSITEKGTYVGVPAKKVK